LNFNFLHICGSTFPSVRENEQANWNHQHGSCEQSVLENLI